MVSAIELARERDERAMKAYRPLPGWPKNPSLRLAKRQQRALARGDQARLEAALAGTALAAEAAKAKTEDVVR